MILDYLQNGTEDSFDDFGIGRSFPHRDLLTGTRSVEFVVSFHFKLLFVVISRLWKRSKSVLIQ